MPTIENKSTDPQALIAEYPDVELAMSLVGDLPGSGVDHELQRRSESDLERLAREEKLSPPAMGVVMGGIYEEAKPRHPSSPLFQTGVGLVGGKEIVQSEAEVSAETTDEQTEVIPDGFVSWRFIEKGSELESKQFDGIVHSFAKSEAVRVADTFEGVTDLGKRVRICDLRSQMTSQVRNGGPNKSQMIRLLDKDVQRDVLLQANAGHGGKTVNRETKIHYSTRKGTKIRAYWMIVNDNNSEGALTVARIADCGDSVAAEAALYRRVLKFNM